MIVKTIWKEHFVYLTYINAMTYFLLHQCEASPPASRLSSSSGAVCVYTATLLHMGVCVGNHISIRAVQVNSAIAGACLLTAGARMHHSRCCFRLPEESRGRID